MVLSSNTCRTSVRLWCSSVLSDFLWRALADVLTPRSRVLTLLSSGVDNVDDLMAEIAEQQDLALEISEAISKPYGFNEDFDEVRVAQWFFSPGHRLLLMPGEHVLAQGKHELQMEAGNDDTPCVFEARREVLIGNCLQK